MQRKRMLSYLMLVMLILSVVLQMSVKLTFAYSYPEVYIAQHNVTYPRVMLPRIVTTANGKLFACYIDNTHSNGSNLYASIWGLISSDDGASWGTPFEIVAGNPGVWGTSEASLIVSNKTILLCYSKWVSSTNSTLHQLISTNNGTTWNNDSTIITGHDYSLAANNGLMMQDYTLIRPYAYDPGTGIYRSSTMSSRDGGVTWTTGGMVPASGVDTHGDDEPSVVELSNHTLYMLMRNNGDHLYKSYSTDKGMTWTTPVASQFTAYATPACLYRYTWSPNKILVSWDDSATSHPLVLDESQDDMVSTVGFMTVASGNASVYYPSITKASDNKTVVAFWYSGDLTEDAKLRQFSPFTIFTTISSPSPTNGSTGNKNVNYSYTVLSTDANNDTIKYTFDWGDGTTEASMFLPNDTSCTRNHSWTKAGKYTITVTATDNQTNSSSEKTILIDAVNVGNIGYLTDDDGDGTYDVFHRNDGLLKNSVQKQSDGTYLIDIDGYGKSNYVFDITSGLKNYETNGSTKKGIPGFELIIVVCAIALVLLWKRKRTK